MRRLLLVPIVAAAALGGAATVSGAAQPSSTPPSGRLVFVEDKAHPAIYSTATDGTRVTRLATNAEDPEVSPDGKLIAFTRVLRGERRGSQVWVMNADGTRQRRLVPGARWSYSPSWAGDGSRLFFFRTNTRYRDRPSIFAVKRDGTYGASCAWHPDARTSWRPRRRAASSLT